MPGLLYKKTATKRVIYQLGLSIDDKTLLYDAVDSYKPYDRKDAYLKDRVLGRIRDLRQHNRRTYRK